MTTSFDALVGEIGTTCQVTRARMVARRLTRHYDKVLAPLGLKSTEFSVLIAIAATPDGRLLDIARKLDFDPSTLTRSLASLGRKGLVEVRQEGHRTRFARLTTAGQEKVTKGYPMWKEAQASAAKIIAGG